MRRAEAAIIAALLHDVIDDTSVSLAEVEGAFGEQVGTGGAARPKGRGLPSGEWVGVEEWVVIWRAGRKVEDAARS